MNICIITSHFPALDKPSTHYATPFLYDYAQEWIKLGHNVNVIHLSRSYPKLFYKIIAIFKFFGIKSFNKYGSISTFDEVMSYSKDEIIIHRLGYKKIIPHHATSKKEIERLSGIVLNIFKENSFDIIISDCIDPVIFVADKIKKTFNIKNIQILHNSDANYVSSITKQHLQNSVDAWLFRSKAQHDKFLPRLKIKTENIKIGYLFSGIKNNEIWGEPLFRKQIVKLIYVGALFKTKGLNTILKALSTTKNKQLKLSIIGDGPDRDYFEKESYKLGIKERVSFLGKKKHSDVFEFFKESDAVILISHETFGMVYVEGMSQACIPIGAEKEGIDGVVVNNKNGFLVPLGNYRKLSSLFDTFESSSPEFLMKMSKEAFETAKTLSNDELAKKAIHFFNEVYEEKKDYN